MIALLPDHRGIPVPTVVDDEPETQIEHVLDHRGIPLPFARLPWSEPYEPPPTMPQEPRKDEPRARVPGHPPFTGEIVGSVSVGATLTPFPAPDPVEERAAELMQRSYALIEARGWTRAEFYASLEAWSEGRPYEPV